jgi:hypothetical protein
MVRIVLVLFIFLSSFSFVKAQTSKDVKEVPVPELRYKAAKDKRKSIFKLFKKKKLTDREEHEAFRKKIADKQKQKSKELKKADKPQYTDPLYFGHKKPPKKRKHGKKKLCKECGLVH